MSGGSSALDPWLTRQPLADRMARWALQPFTPSAGNGRRAWPLRVLEPSAGRGSLVLGLLHAVHSEPALRHLIDPREIVCIEMHAGRARALRETLGPLGVRVIQRHFVSWAIEYAEQIEAGEAQRFDLVIANPPFANGQDVEHIEHMSRIGCSVTPIVRSVFTQLRGEQGVGSLFDRVQLLRLVHLGRAAFDDDENSKAGTPRHDFNLLELRQGARRESEDVVRVSWW